MNTFNKEHGCYFTKHDIKHVDYRDVHLLDRFVDSHGKVLSRKRSGLCARYHRLVTEAIKRARYMMLMPYVRQ